LDLSHTDQWKWITGIWREVIRKQRGEWDKASLEVAQSYNASDVLNRLSVRTLTTTTPTAITTVEE